MYECVLNRHVCFISGFLAPMTILILLWPNLGQVPWGVLLYLDVNLDDIRQGLLPPIFFQISYLYVICGVETNAPFSWMVSHKHHTKSGHRFCRLPRLYMSSCDRIAAPLCPALCRNADSWCPLHWPRVACHPPPLLASLLSSYVETLLFELSTFWNCKVKLNFNNTLFKIFNI